MIYVVLGMHKSGTTLVSRILHQTGIDMGDFDESVGYDDGNWFERAEFLALNRSLLAPCLIPTVGARLEAWWSGASSSEIAANRDSVAILKGLPAAAPPETERRMRALVQALDARHADWGFKDPRTCLTYPLWEKVLPPHRIIGVYRGYADFVRRNRKGRNLANPARWWRALRSWLDYNTAMADAIERSSLPTLLVRYDDLMGDPSTWKRLERFVGRSLADARRPDLYRVRPGGESLVDRALATLSRRDPRAVWQRLQRLDAASAAACEPAARGSYP